MSKRLQVLMEPREYRIYQKKAREEGLSMGEWVRRTLRLVVPQRPKKTREQIMAAIKRASQYSFPAPDIDQMLAEIGKGRLGQ